MKGFEMELYPGIVQDLCRFESCYEGRAKPEMCSFFATVFWCFFTLSPIAVSRSLVVSCRKLKHGHGFRS